MPTQGPKVWISRREISVLFDIPYDAIPRVVALNGIRTRRLPGTAMKIHREDVERALECSIHQGEPTGQPAESVA